MLTSVTKFSADSGVPLVVLREQIAKHRIRHVRLSQTGYPLYSERALIDACAELGGQDRKMFLTIPYEDYKRIQRLARARGQHVGSYAGWLLGSVARVVYDRRFAD